MIKLNVPYSEKDEAKKFGAWWNQEHKCWCIPDSKQNEIENFKQWLSFYSDELVILQKPIYLVETTRKCWKCNNIIPIFGVANRRDKKAINVPSYDDMDDVSNYRPERDYYHKHFGFSLRFFEYIQGMSNEDLHKIKVIAPDYQLRFSKTVGYKYFANTCPHCKMIQGDFELYEEPDEGFMILYNEKDVTLHVLDEQFDMVLEGQSADIIII